MNSQASEAKGVQPPGRRGTCTVCHADRSVTKTGVLYAHVGPPGSRRCPGSARPPLEAAIFAEARELLAALIDELPVQNANGHAAVRLTHLTDLLERIPQVTGALVKDRQSWA